MFFEILRTVSFINLLNIQIPGFIHCLKCFLQIYTPSNTTRETATQNSIESPPILVRSSVINVKITPNIDRGQNTRVHRGMKHHAPGHLQRRHQENDGHGHGPGRNIDQNHKQQRPHQPAAGGELLALFGACSFDAHQVHAYNLIRGRRRISFNPLQLIGNGSGCTESQMSSHVFQSTSFGNVHATVGD